jgi:DNA-binding MarR family transcriptional regulator
MLYRYGQSYLEHKLKAYNIGSGQFTFLMALLHQDGIRQESLASRLNIDKGTTARAMKKLEESGYISRQVDPKDKRANIIYVTPKALTLKPVLIDISLQWTETITSGFTPQENEQVILLLQRMSENAFSLMKMPEE